MSAATFPPLQAIAAMGENRAISFQNKLPWRIAEEMAWFKEKTSGHTLLMGRKTFESMGGVDELKGRKIFVLSHEKKKLEGAETLSDWRKLKPAQIQGQLFVCGGEEVYKQLLPYVRDLWLTHVFLSPQADRFFPSFEDKFKPKETMRENPQFKVVHYVNANPLPFPASK